MKRNYAMLGTLAAMGLALPVQGEIMEFVVPLDGLQEVPPADLDGVGIAYLSIDTVALTISWHIDAYNILFPLNGAHIHAAPAGQNGSVIVNFSSQLDGVDLFDADLAAVIADPAGHYVNLHNATFPGGAIRGQLPGIADFPCGDDRFCGPPGLCVFDGLNNLSLGEGSLVVNDSCNLVVGNIGSSGADGVSQDLPDGTEKMVTGLATPNFSLSQPGTKVSVDMIADVPGDLFSTFTIENIGDGTLHTTGDFSPIGTTLYQVHVFLDGQLASEFSDLPTGELILDELTNLTAIDCTIDGDITYDTDRPVGVIVSNGAISFGNGFCVTAQDPVVTGTEQIRIDNYFTDTGDVTMTFQYAGSAACGFGAGDCCTDNGGAGCEDLFCCADVCAANPACCDVAWDASCAALALGLCQGCEVIPCDGDTNGDGTVDPLDAGYVLARLGCPVGTGDPDCDAADANGDVLVDPLDVGYVLSRFGPCP